VGVGDVTSLLVVGGVTSLLAVGGVTSLLAVLNRDWTRVNIHIVDVIWFVQLKPIMPVFCTNRRHH
jgi:hypothetical protein